MNLIFWGTPIFAFIVVLLVHAYSNLRSIKDNWSEHRCNPIYIPFAGLVDDKSSASENFGYCLNLIGKNVISQYTDVINGQFSIVADALNGIASPLAMFRTMLTSIRKFVLTFTNSTLGKVTGPVSMFGYYLNKIQDLLRRMVGEGYIAAMFGATFVSGVEGFVSLALTVIKGFVVAMLIISFTLALFQPQLLAIVLVIASSLAAAGV